MSNIFNSTGGPSVSSSSNIGGPRQLEGISTGSENSHAEEHGEPIRRIRQTTSDRSLRRKGSGRNFTEKDKSGVCRKGASPFGHLPGARNGRREDMGKHRRLIGKSKMTGSSSSANETVCNAFLNGSCPFGDQCKQKHIARADARRSSKPCFRFTKTGTCHYGDNCKFSHDPPGLTAYEKYSISVFKQFIQDDGPLQFRNNIQVSAFVTGMVEKFRDRLPDLLMTLTAPGGQGLKRLRGVIAMCGNADHLNSSVLRTLDLLLCDELSTPLYATRRGDLLMQLFNTPGFFELLLDNVSKLESSGTRTISLFLLELCRQFLEARHSEKVRTLASALCDLNCPISSRLCSYIVLQKESTQPQESGQLVPEVAIWERDVLPPGRRHDNDFLNFRDISIIPTIDEIAGSGAQAASYLPLHSGDNSFIHDDLETSYLDSKFRLYREDMVRSLREELLGKKRCWNCLAVMGLDCGLDENSNGRAIRTPSLVFRLELPDPLRNLKAKQLEYFWKNSKSLQKGSLVCLCRRSGDSDDEDLRPLSFGTIETREVSLLCHEEGPFLGILLNRIEDIIDFVSDIGSKKNMNLSIVEARCSFFSYESVLRKVQSMESVPFSNELVRGVKNGARPGYLPTSVQLPVDFGVTEKLDLDTEDSFLEKLTKHTSLNHSQAKALFLGLTSRVALIQGPPGTGKSFVGSVIARTILENSSAKILCVCYTNHALDQVLEDLLAKGVTNLVRIGGRSKSEVLQKYSVWELMKRRAQEGTFTTRNGKTQAVLHAELKAAAERINQLQTVLSEEFGSWTGSWGEQLQIYLREFRPLIYSELCTEVEDEDGFQLIGKDGRPVSEDIIWEEWRRGNPKPGYITRSEDKSGIWKLDASQREVVIEEWRLAVTADAREELSSCLKEFIRKHQSLKQLRDSRANEVFKEARVIGATTTGVAIHKNLVDHSEAEVILVEEAGEILEAHVLSALGKYVKHMILIGDHRQLRPKVESYSLTAASGNGFGLDISLFERLILNPNMKSVMLEVQHRMRKEFSDLLRMKTYPTLQDAESTSDRPHTRGIRNDLLFFTHSVPESAQSNSLADSTSKTNKYEAELAVEVARLLLLQGYAPEQMVILTPYLGQLRILEQVMSASLPDVLALVEENDLEDVEKLAGVDPLLESNQSGQSLFVNKEIQIKTSSTSSMPRSIRVATIDNFQGEEADIVIISLVRSNGRGQIGFLSDAKRVNVLLSRARNSMFVIGNMETFRTSKAGEDLWIPLLEKLEREGNLRPYLESYCEEHVDDIVYLTHPESFRELRPNGGCLQRCLFRMNCGHCCPLRCHPVDPRHERIKCHEPCLRRPVGCSRGHSCPKECSQDCRECNVPVEVTLPCGHSETTKCNIADNEKRLALIRCSELVVHESFATCDHKEVTIKCYESTSARPSCPKRCSERLSCGHQCPQRCGTCSRTKMHGVCKAICKRTLFCGHTCGKKCHEGPCQACTMKCVIRCLHSKCPKQCPAPCAPCVEPCAWNCVHEGNSEVICGAPCVRKRCDLRCELSLKCGHKCPSLCGEKCPSESFCQICASDAKKRTIVDMVMLTEYGQLTSLDSDPIIVLPCNHFYCMSTLDGIMELDKEASMLEGKPVIMPKSCPQCRQIIHSVFRYGSVQKLAELALLERKHTITCEERLKQGLQNLDKHDIATRLKKLNKVLSQVRRSPMKAVYEAVSKEHRHEFLRHRNHRLEIQVLMELGKVSLLGISSVSEEDEMYMQTRNALTEAIAIADSSNSYRSQAKLRILMVEAFLAESKLEEQVERNNPFYQSREKEAISSCQWIIQSGLQAICQEIRERAEELLPKIDSKRRLELGRQERVAVKKAIERSFVPLAAGGSNSHWYFCPNGHEYYIGECGQPMEEALCIECGVPIGGRNHSLLAGNQQSSRD